MKPPSCLALSSVASLIGYQESSLQKITAEERRWDGIHHLKALPSVTRCYGQICLGHYVGDGIEVM